jgi:hypothetical protein
MPIESNWYALAAVKLVAPIKLFDHSLDAKPRLSVKLQTLKSVDEQVVEERLQ